MPVPKCQHRKVIDRYATVMNASRRDKLTESIQQRDDRVERGGAKVDKSDVPEALTEDQLHDAEARRDSGPNQGRHAEQPLALHSGPVVVPIAGYLATGSAAP